MWSILFILVAISAQGLSLRCHSCESQTNPSCHDPFSTKGVASFQCGISSTNQQTWSSLFPGLPDTAHQQSITSSCIKSESTSATGRPFVFRGCSVVDNMCSAIKLSVESQGGRVTFCETCQGELCNAAPGTARVAILVLLVSVYVSAFSML